MLLFIEDRFGIEFDEDVTEKIDTVQDFVEHIEAKLSKRAEAV
jgi:acyl carrier protein